MSSKDKLRELEAIWYQRLADEKFPEIEDCSLPDRPLKEWHSFGFISSKSQIRQAHRREYQERAEIFYHRPDLDEICKVLVNHGNSQITSRQAKKILALHIEGITERRIAQKLRKSKTCIHGVLERLKAWMKVS